MPAATSPTPGLVASVTGRTVPCLGGGVPGRSPYLGSIVLGGWDTGEWCLSAFCALLSGRLGRGPCSGCMSYLEVGATGPEKSRKAECG